MTLEQRIKNKIAELKDHLERNETGPMKGLGGLFQDVHVELLKHDIELLESLLK